MRIHRSLLVLSLCLAAAVVSGAAEDEPPKLLGRCEVDALREAPYVEWFDEAHAAYEPNGDVLRRLRGAALDDVEIELFFGTWCGDSRREVPRWVKLLAEAGLSSERVALIAVDNDAESIKRSPDGEERGREIYRVPTAIVRRDGIELARVVEFPVLSFERDLLAILEGRSYEPNYASYPIVRDWLRDGLLADPNVDPHGLAGAVRHLVSGEGELAAAARVLESRGDTAEAIKLYEANCAIHRDSAGCRTRLARALHAAGENERAHRAAERALRLNDDPDRVAELVELVGRTAPPEAPED